MGVASPAKGTALLFGALAVVWGASFLFIRVGLEGLNPLQVAAIRVILGALTLAAVMVVTGRSWPREGRWLGHLAVLGVLLCVVPFLLYSWAGQYIPSALSSVYNGTTPIMTMLVSLAALPSERLTRSRFAALLLGALGVILIAAPWTAASGGVGPHFWTAQLACLGATACYGMGYVYTRRFLSASPFDATTAAATQVGMAAAVMVVISLVFRHEAFAPVSLTPAVVGSLVVLGAAGTGFSYIWNMRVIQDWGATRASMVTYLTPVVGVVLGAVVLDESVRWHEPVGAVVVLVAVMISQGGVATLRSSRGK